MNKQITMSLSQIAAFEPCTNGWKKLLVGLGRTKADDEQIPLEFILHNNGIKDAIWCMRVNWFKHEKLYMTFLNNCVARAQKHAAYAAASASAAYAAYAAASAAAADAAADAAYAAAADAAAAASASASAATYAAADAAADAAAYAASASASAADAERNLQYQDLLRLLQAPTVTSTTSNQQPATNN